MDLEGVRLRYQRTSLAMRFSNCVEEWHEIICYLLREIDIQDVQPLRLRHTVNPLVSQ